MKTRWYRMTPLQREIVTSFIQDDIDTADRLERTFTEADPDVANSGLSDAITAALSSQGCKVCRAPWAGSMMFHTRECWVPRARSALEAWNAASRR